MGDMTATTGIWKVTHIVNGLNGESHDGVVTQSFVYTSVLVDAYKDSPLTLRIDERLGYKNWHTVYSK